MKSADKPPAGGGTTKGWFEYYKWDVDGEAFVPVPEDVAGGAPEVGDTLWFLMDNQLLGCVPVLSVSADELNSQLEIHYDTRQLQDFEQQTKYWMPHSTGKCVFIGDISYYDAVKRDVDARYLPRDKRVKVEEKTAG
jgi:hypothetical protein